MKIVLQKYIAQAGFCSRRMAENFIKAGQVKVNNDKAELGMCVCENDKVEVNGKVLKPQIEKIYIKFNKPIGVTCTNRNFKKEKNVFDFLPKEYKSLHIVGRLDKMSRGLVILTNDGEFTEKMTHPRYGHEKKYFIRIKNQELRIKEAEDIINQFKNGIDIPSASSGQGKMDFVKAKDVKFFGRNKFEIVLTEGKKRQIRRMFEVLGFKVVDLKRVSIDKYKLGSLKEGEWEKLNVTY